MNSLAEHWQLANDTCDYIFSSPSFYEKDSRQFLSSINWFVKTRTMALAKRGAFITPKSVGSNPSPAIFFKINFLTLLSLAGTPTIAKSLH